jgi:hypothetical protein
MCGYCRVGLDPTRFGVVFGEEGLLENTEIQVVWS